MCRTLLISLVSTILLGCASPRQCRPPNVVFRDLETVERPGDEHLLEVTENVVLFVPSGFVVPQNGVVSLTVHFHTAPWFAAEEHSRRGATNPLLVYSGGTGSSAYQRPFEDPELFSRLLDQTASRLVVETGRADVCIGDVEISSFSAGYGAVREILKEPRYVNRIQTVLLADSLYAGYADSNGAARQPVYRHIASFVEFARLAVDGKKRFLITYSSVVPGTYASTEECARAIVEALGGEITPFPSENSSSISADLSYPIVARYDCGGFHVWGYAGDDAKAHLAHVRSIADFWTALERDTLVQ